MLDDALIPVDASAIAFDLPCSACGYNLRGLARDAACPECGRAVRATLPPDSVQPASFTLDIDLHCTQCGYNLRGIHLDSTCPECGLGTRSIVPLAGPVEMFDDGQGNILLFDRAGVVVFQQGVRHVFYGHEITGYSRRGPHLTIENYWFDVTLPDLTPLRRRLMDWGITEHDPQPTPAPHRRALAILIAVAMLIGLIFLIDAILAISTE